ncbi:MAG: hypothetical protein HFJ51_01395 [Clostridia bacterium]|nr:hypothetical protein [Clostridia bacterium]
MIGSIREVREEAGSQVMILGKLQCKAVHPSETEGIDVSTVLSRNELERVLSCMGMKSEKDLLGMKADFWGIPNNFHVMLYLELGTQCEFGPAAKQVEEDIVGRIFERELGELHLETEADDKYVTCKVGFSRLRQLEKIFGQESIWDRPGIYLQQTNKLYIGFHIK